MAPLLARNFRIFRFLGFWKEKDEVQPVCRVVFKYSSVTIYTFFVLSLIIELLNANTFYDFINSLVITADWLASWIKMIYFLSYQEDMAVLRRKLESKSFSPKTIAEFNIAKKYEILTTTTFNTLTTIFGLTSFFSWMTPFICREPTLPYKTYDFCGLTKSTCFAVSYLLQTYWLFVGLLCSISVDTLTFGSVILLTGHFDLIRHRLSNFPAEDQKDIFRNHVISYGEAKETASKTENFFMPIILSTFMGSLLMLCTLIYFLSQESIILHAI